MLISYDSLRIQLIMDHLNGSFQQKGHGNDTLKTMEVFRSILGIAKSRGIVVSWYRGIVVSWYRGIGRVDIVCMINNFLA